MAVAWQMYDETGSKVLLGMIGLVQFLPAFLFVLQTGIAADRFGRRLMMTISVAIETVCAVGILVMVTIDRFEPYWILSILFVFGASRAFFRPASQSLVVNLVPERDFPNAVGWNASSWQAASIIGPVTGGLLYGISAPIAYATAVVMFALATVFVTLIPKPEQRMSTEKVTIEVLMGGFSYIFSQPVVLGAILLDLFAVLLGGAVALLPVYARDILDVGEQGLGLLRAAPGIGAIIMTFFLASIKIRAHAGLIMFAGTAFFGLATMIFGLSLLPWLSILALGCVGAADMISVYVRGTLLQLWTPDELRGRVNAVNSIFISASNELGEARAGFMAAWLGAIPAVALGGAMAIVVSFASALMFPQLRKIQRLESPETIEREREAAGST